MKRISFFATTLVLIMVIMATFNMGLANAQQFGGYGWGPNVLYYGQYAGYIPTRPPLWRPIPPIPWYYQNQYRYPTLNVVCYPNSSWAYVGNTIGWTASVSGGSGYYYRYYWTGTDYPQSLDSRTLNVYYQNPGAKNMNVRVISSDGQVANAYCGSVYINPHIYYQQLYPYY